MITIITLFITLVGCDSEKSNTFIIGGIPDQNTSTLNERFDELAKYIGEKTGLEVKYISSSDYSALVTAFGRNEVHLGWFRGLTGVQARSLVENSEAVAQRPRDEEFESVFIVNKKNAIIGPSGAGKTTLLNLLSKQLTTYTGIISLNNKNVKEYKNWKEYTNEVGIIRQQFDLIEPLSVVNNVLAGRLKDWSLFKTFKSLFFSQDKEVAIAALNSVRLSDHIYSKTAILSGGEKQRVAIARLLVQNPNIVLADEPVASLDQSLAEEVISLLIANTIDKTLIVSIHTVKYALKYFDRVIALKDGKLFFDKDSSKITADMIEKLYER